VSSAYDVTSATQTKITHTYSERVELTHPSYSEWFIGVILDPGATSLRVYGYEGPDNNYGYSSGSNSFSSPTSLTLSYSNQFWPAVSIHCFDSQKVRLSKLYTATITDYGKIFGVDYGDLDRFYTLLLPAAAGGDRVLSIAGRGTSPVSTQNIDYFTASTPGNYTDFGDTAHGARRPAALSNGADDRYCYNVGYDTTYRDYIEYGTISVPANAIDFGDLTVTRGMCGASSNGTNERGVFMGGRRCPVSHDTIDYITINATGNATDFGDLTAGRGYSTSGCSNRENERAVRAGGSAPDMSPQDDIDYITINSTGNATSFGDLSANSGLMGATSNTTNERGVIVGVGTNNATGVKSDDMDYITINSTGNATDFGDLTQNYIESEAGGNGVGEVGLIFCGTNNAESKTNTVEKITVNTAGNSADFGDISQTRDATSSANNAA
jgi:hypothetical protein